MGPSISPIAISALPLVRSIRGLSMIRSKGLMTDEYPFPLECVPNGGVQGTNDFPGQRYDGPQPPSGTHRYYFKIFALDRTLDLKPGAKRREVDAAMKGHVIAQGQLMGRYSKK